MSEIRKDCFILLHTNIQFILYHLLKMLTFPKYVFWHFCQKSVTEVTWVYMCMFCVLRFFSIYNKNIMGFSLGLHWIDDCLWYDHFHYFISTEGWVWEFFLSSNAFLNLFLRCFEVFIVEVLYFFIKFIPSYFLIPSYAKFYLSAYTLETMEWNQFGHWRYIFMLGGGGVCL